MAPGPLDIVQQIMASAARSDRELRANQSPHETYQTKVEAVSAQIDNALDQLSSESSPSDQARLRDEVIKCGGGLEALRLQYQATVEDEEKLYEQQQRATLERLCCSIVTTLGAVMVESSLQNLSAKAPHQSIPVGSLRIPDSTQAGPDHRSRNGNRSALDVAGVNNPTPNVKATKVSVLYLEPEGIRFAY